MTEIDELDLLRRYATTRDEAAFASLTARRLAFVYSIALRKTGGDRHLAEDVAQQVFVALARNARGLRRHPALGAWIYTATRNLAANAVRGEQRRKRREQEALVNMQDSTEPIDGAAMDPVSPVLEEALDEMRERDRDVLVMRFFEQKSLADIGESFHLSEDSARKRVERALERLRCALERKGVVSTASALSGTLSTGVAFDSVPTQSAATVANVAVNAAAASPHAWIAGTCAGLTKLHLGMAAAFLIVCGILGLAWTRSDGGRAGPAVVASKPHTVDDAETHGDRRVPETSAAMIALPVFHPERVAATSAVQETELEPEDEHRARVRRRYARFFQQQGLSPQQIELFIDLRLALTSVREDLQAAIRQNGMAGDAPGIAELRKQLTAPYMTQFVELLGGHEGYMAYAAFEKSSYYRALVVDPLNEKLAGLSFSLTDEQEEKLTAIVASSDRPRRLKPENLSLESQFDWQEILDRSRPLLNPAQFRTLEAEVERLSRRRPRQ